MTLNYCSELWGEAHLMYGEPPVRFVEEAYFVPYRANASWGLFDSSHQIIIEGLDLRGGQRTPHQMHLGWPEDLCFSTAPESGYIYCGWLNPHYGHFLVNSLPKFWPFLRSGPRCKIILASSISEMSVFAQIILGRLGLNEESFCNFDEPVRLKNVYIPTPALLEQYWAYSIYRDLCLRVSDGLWKVSEVDEIVRPVYLSKARLPVGVGRFANEALIEEVVSSAGVEIVYPEVLTWAEQIRLLARRRCIIGPTGSAFHSLIFAPRKQNLWCINPAAQINSNFALFDLLTSNKSRYVYQEGMTYRTSHEFLTIVQAADAREIGNDLVEMIRNEYMW